MLRSPQSRAPAFRPYLISIPPPADPARHFPGGFHFLVLSALVEWEVVGPVSASLVGFVVGSCVTYTLNSRFTFKSTRSHAGAMPRYFAVAGVAFVLNGVLMDVFVHRLGVFYLLAQFLTSALVLCWTFTGYRVWAFAEKRPRPEAS
ncbi:MAG: hypothetical protein B7Z45_02580 [Azorhizobium sp. 12-66-6]|nr:MAG: hypothetical protein B7Z45_02580 [Azorhizobium sp. 12-66-6]